MVMTEEEMILDEHRRKIRERLKLPKEVYIPGWGSVQGWLEPSDADPSE